MSVLRVNTSKYMAFQILEVAVSRPLANMIQGQQVCVLEVKKVGGQYRYQVMNLHDDVAWMDEGWLRPPLGIS